MLFLESKTLNLAVAPAVRTKLLQELHERNIVPLIRSHRLRSFEDVLLGVDHVAEMEMSLANSTESTIGEPYVRGDLFCFQDYILFLVFEDEDSIRAGIVYEARTPEPFRKLDSFCHDVRSLLRTQEQQITISFPEWETGAAAMPRGFRTFVERQDADSLYTSLRKETMSKRILAASKLEDESARLFESIEWIAGPDVGRPHRGGRVARPRRARLAGIETPITADTSDDFLLVRYATNLYASYMLARHRA